MPTPFDVVDITSEFSVKVRNRIVKLVDFVKHPSELWKDVRDIVEETASQHLLKRYYPHRAKLFSKDTVNVTKERRMANVL